MDQFHLDQLRLFHVMDMYDWYTVTCTVPDATPSSAVLASDSIWMIQAWSPNNVQGEQAFAHDELQRYLLNRDVYFRPVPSRKHQNNALQPKHDVIRSICLRLEFATFEEISALFSNQAVTIFSDFYGSSTASGSELENGFSKPIDTRSELQSVPQEIVNSGRNFWAEPNLTLILRSK